VPKLEANVPDCPAPLAVKLPPLIAELASTYLPPSGELVVVAPPTVVDPSTNIVPFTYKSTSLGLSE